MPNPAKAKGSSWERDLAEHLTTVFGVNFQRSMGSGAWMGGKNFYRASKLSKVQQLMAEGDIIVPEELSHCKFEAKFYKDFSFGSLLSTNKLLETWITQAKSVEKFWFLVFKINHQGAFVVTEDFKNLTLTWPTNYNVYNGIYRICAMPGFFETNKTALLQHNKDSNIITTLDASTPGHSLSGSHV